MKRKVYLFVLMIGILLPFSNSYATDVHTQSGSHINYIIFHSYGTSLPNREGTASVVFTEPLNWIRTDGSTGECNCSESVVAIRENDKHLISAILAARATNTPVRLYADDSLKVTADNCYLRALQY